MTHSGHITQEVVSENQKIFEKIQHHLKTAGQEILVATSWFTDEVLFELLLNKLSTGVKVELIIAENSDNEKLDFDLLSAAGASVVKIRSVGYGIMHQKFCVIDRQVAIHGSYNWSNNAKTNNHESVIVTNHRETVNSLVTTFFDIKERAVAILHGVDPNSLSFKESKDSPKANTIVNTENLQEVSPLEFTNVLRAMVAAETSIFDRSDLRRSGYERARATNGDAQVLSTALDSLYSTFITDINIEEEKREGLIIKIEDLKLTTERSLDNKQRLQIDAIDNELESNSNSLRLRIRNIDGAISLDENEINTLRSITIRQDKDKIQNIREELNANLRDFVRPRIKYYEIVPVISMLALVFVYLCLFYSSAAYILIFSETDTKEQLAAGTTPNPPQIFEPRALELVTGKGGTAKPYVLLFVIIPIALASIDKFIDKKNLKVLFGICLWLVDILVAIKISKAINEINYLIGDTDQPFKLLDVFSDISFYLVFAFGILGLLLYKALFSKLIDILRDIHPETTAQKNSIYRSQLQDQISKLEDQIASYCATIVSLEKNIIDQRQEKEDSEIKLLKIPSTRAALAEKIESELRSVKETIQGIVHIYISYVQRNRVPIHVDSIKDRINVFLEGWNEFLHNEYAVERAKEKSRQALDVVTRWQDQKLVISKVDHRISLN